MAPAKKQRPNNFFEVGVQGRRTGITLQDKGVRDEHGLEPLDGIFSSPAKSPERELSVARGDATISASEAMDIESGSAPDPQEAISTRKLTRSNKTYFPPPRGKSPMKTNIRESPQRLSMGPPSRANLPPSSDSVPELLSASPRAINRRLDFSNDVPTSRRARAAATPEGDVRKAGRLQSSPRRDVYDLTPSPKRGAKRSHDESFGGEEGDTQAGASLLQINNEADAVAFDDSAPLFAVEDPEEELVEQVEEVEAVEAVEEDQQNGEDDEVEEDEEESDVIPTPATQRRIATSTASRSRKAQSPPPARTKPGKRTATRAKKNANSATAVEESEPEEPALEEPELVDSTLELVERPRKRGRPPKAVQVENSVVEDAAIEAAVKKKRGRKPRVVEVESSNLEESAVEGSVKKKRGRKPKGKAAVGDSSIVDVSTVSELPSSISGAKKRGGAARQPGQKSMLPPASRGRPRLDAALGPSAVRGGSVTPAEGADPSKSNVLLRSQTPFDDSFSRTRSGRTVIPPINYYLGERAEYSQDGTLHNIVKAEIAPQIKQNRGPKPAGRRRGRREDTSEFMEPEEDDLEEWELEEPGVLSGYVQAWDEEENQETEELEETELAMAFRAIQPRDVAGGGFAFARIFKGFTWFSSGIVRIPVKGAKRPKPSRKMHLVFYVIRGRVEVTIGNNIFTINGGGAFQVPRGTIYGIKNSSDTEAKLFFTQASLQTVDAHS